MTNYNRGKFDGPGAGIFLAAGVLFAAWGWYEPLDGAAGVYLLGALFMWLVALMIFTGTEPGDLL
ncbi:MAG TPA: hypothetical protein VM054_07480 [bacterium]|nr:hypothetical protein [bacterium]